MILVQFAARCEPDTMFSVHTDRHIAGAVIMLLIRVTVDSTWRGGRALAAHTAASHLELNINIMANKIIPFP